MIFLCNKDFTYCIGWETETFETMETVLKAVVNSENIEDIKTRICNSTFYKNPNYSVATNIIDNIIFRAKGNELTLK